MPCAFQATLSQAYLGQESVSYHYFQDKLDGITNFNAAHVARQAPHQHRLADVTRHFSGPRRSFSIEEMSLFALSARRDDDRHDTQGNAREQRAQKALDGSRSQLSAAASFDDAAQNIAMRVSAMKDDISFAAALKVIEAAGWRTLIRLDGAARAAAAMRRTKG